MELTSIMGLESCCVVMVWGLPFQLSASRSGKRVASHPVGKYEQITDRNRHLPGQRRNLSEPGRDFLAALPGRTFVLGPIPRPVLLRKRGEKARNQACRAPRPLRASPLCCPRLQEAGRRERPARRVGTAPPASQARGGAARRCHCSRRAASRAARTPAAVGPLALQESATVLVPPGRRSGETGSRRRLHPTRPGAHAAGAWTGEGEVTDPFFWEVRR